MSKKTSSPNQKVVMGYRERLRQYRQRLTAKRPELDKKELIKAIESNTSAKKRIEL